MANQEEEVFHAEFSAEADDFKNVVKVMEQVSKSSADAAKGLKLLQKIDLKNLQVNLDTGQIKKQVAEVDKTVSDLKKKFRDEPIQGPEQPKKGFNTDELVAQFERVGATANATNRSVGTMFKDFQDGFALVAAGGGTFTGIQQAMFGLGNAGGTLGKVFTFLGRGADELGIANDRLAQAGIRASAQMAQLSSTLVSQTKIVKDVAKQELGLSKGQFNAVDQQIQRVEKAYKDMQTTIESGGKPTAQQISRIKTETTSLEQAFKELKAQGIIPAGTETEKLINQLVTGSAKGRNATALLVQQYKAMGDAAEKAEQKQKQQGQGIVKQASLISRFISALNIFKKTSDETATSLNKVSSAGSQAASGIEKVGSSASRVTRVMELFSAVFSGTFVGNILSKGFQTVTAGLSAMKDDFFEANGAVQNFRITMANMMKGTGLDVDETQARIESFVRDVVAKTPFELTDAFESFQKLLISGFDPQKWLIPVADAAAAVNKPMEQLIGAMAKIQVGAKGAGVDMLRDFGIPVNQVGAFIDSATGRMLSQEEVLNDQRNLYKLSADELSNLGFQFKKWEFDKQGSLIGNTNDALQTLNGFLQQNATFAGAAEGRSRSLTGVISNLKDFWTNLLIVMGQPIFERLTNAGQLLLEKLNFLTPVLTSFAEAIGQNVSQAMDTALGFIQNFDFSLQNMPIFIQNLVGTITALFQGDWATAWQFFLITIDEALVSGIDILASFVDSAFDWGMSFGQQIADGLFEAAESAITAALEFIGDTIASFLAPGSPPEEGPLSNIDKWGKPLGALFSEGLAEGVTPKPVVDALNPIADAMSGAKGPLTKLLEEREKILERLRRADELGLDTTFLKEQLQTTQTQIDAMVDQADSGVKELDKALKPAGTKTAPKGSGGRGGGAAAGREKPTAQTFQEKFAAEKAALDERKKAGLISQTDYLKEMLKLEKDYVKKSQEEGITAGLEEHIATIKSLNEQATVAEKNELQARFDAGIISEEEYTKSLLKIAEQHAEDKLALGQELTKAEIDNIKSLQVAIEGFNKRGGGGKAGVIDEDQFKIPTAGDILSGFSEELPQQLGEVGTQAATAFVTNITAKTQEKFANFESKVGESIDKFKAGVIKKFENLNLPSLETLLFGGAIGVGFLALVGIISPPILVLIGLVGLAIVAFQNWDAISKTLQDTYATLSDAVQTFMDELGGQEKTFETFNRLATDTDSVLGQLSKNIQKSLSQVFAGDFTGAKDTFTRIFSEIDISGITTSLQAIGTAIGNTIWSMLPVTLQEQLTRLKETFTAAFGEGRLGGELVRLFEALQKLGAEILPGVIAVLKTFGTVIFAVVAGIVVFATSLVTGFVDALPFIEGFVAGIVREITGFVEFFTGMIQLVKAGFALFTGDTANAATLFKAALVSMQAGATDIVGGIIAVVMNAGLALVAFVNSFFITMVATVLSFIPGFANAGAQLFAWKDLVIEGLSGLQAEATEILFGLIQQIKDLFLGLYDYLVGDSIFPDLVAMILTILGTLKSSGMQLIKDTIDGWVDKFTDMVKDFKEVGVNVIEGLLQGIKSAESLVVEHLKTLILDKVIGGAKSLLGIESPSKVMAKIGADTMVGFQQGVEDEAPSVAAATSQVFKSIFFKIAKVSGTAKPILDERTREFNREFGAEFLEMFKSFGANLDEGELNRTITRIANLSGSQFNQSFLEAFQEASGGVDVGDFVKSRFTDFLGKFNEVVGSMVDEASGNLDRMTDAIAQFDKELQSRRGTAFVTRNIVENMLGQDVSPEELKKMAETIKQMEGPRSDQDKAILDAFDAQQKFNAALEQQAKIQEQMQAIEAQRAQLDLLKQKLALLNEAKDAGVGADIIAGLTGGLDQPLDKALEAMAAVTQALIEKAKKELGIASPSTVFKDIGDNVVLSLADSLKGGAGLVSAGIESIAKVLTTSIPISDIRGFEGGSSSAVSNSQTNHITQNIGDKLDLALIQRRNEELFANAFR